MNEPIYPLSERENILEGLQTVTFDSTIKSKQARGNITSDGGERRG